MSVLYFARGFRFIFTTSIALLSITTATDSEEVLSEEETSTAEFRGSEGVMLFQSGRNVLPTIQEDFFKDSLLDLKVDYEQLLEVDSEPQQEEIEEIEEIEEDKGLKYFRIDEEFYEVDAVKRFVQFDIADEDLIINPEHARYYTTVCLELFLCYAVLQLLYRWRAEKGEIPAAPSEKDKEDIMESQSQAVAAILSRRAELTDTIMLSVKEGDSVRLQELLSDATAATPAFMEPLLAMSDSFGCTPLHISASRGDTLCASMLLKNKASPDAVDDSLETPLHMAARANHVAMCELLIAHNADLNVTNIDGETPLIASAKAGAKDACTELFNAGGHAGDCRDSDLPPLVTGLLFRQLVSRPSPPTMCELEH